MDVGARELAAAGSRCGLATVRDIESRARGRPPVRRLRRLARRHYVRISPRAACCFRSRCGSRRTARSRVRAELGGESSTPLDELRLRTINGLPAAVVCEQMLARPTATRAPSAPTCFRAASGSTTGSCSVRRQLLTWISTGLKGVQSFPGSTRIAAAARRRGELRAAVPPAKPSSEDTVGHEAGHFCLARQAAVAGLHARRPSRSCATIGTKNLIIDLRDNGGGDDVMWIEGVMPYIATQAVSHRIHVSQACRGRESGEGRSRGRRGRWRNRHLVSRAARAIRCDSTARSLSSSVPAPIHRRGVQQCDAGFPLCRVGGHRAAACARI